MSSYVPDSSKQALVQVSATPAVLPFLHFCIKNCFCCPYSCLFTLSLCVYIKFIIIYAWSFNSLPSQRFENAPIWKWNKQTGTKNAHSDLTSGALYHWWLPPLLDLHCCLHYNAACIRRLKSSLFKVRLYIFLGSVGGFCLFFNY